MKQHTRSKWAGALALSLGTLGLAAVTAAPAQAQVGGVSAFDQGRVRLSLGAGTSGYFGNRYIVLGVGVGYYLVKGLELAVDSQVLLGGDPFLAQVSPGVRYVFWQTGGPVMPYIGGFYRHLFINSDLIDDIDSLGGRAGIFYTVGRGGYFGIGVAVEQLLNCDEDLFDTCTDIYPELAFSLSF
jgi:hypothetical protein